MKKSDKEDDRADEVEGAVQTQSMVMYSANTQYSYVVMGGVCLKKGSLAMGKIVHEECLLW